MTNTISSYEQQGLDFIAKHELEFRAVLVGDDCPTSCEDAENANAMDQVNVYPRKTHIHGKHYRCTLSHKGKGHFSIDYWNSYADEQTNWIVGQHNSLPLSLRLKAAGNKRTQVTPYDVLTCLTKSDPGTFEDFCSEFGFWFDSRKAESVYHSVQTEWTKVQRFFTPEEIEELQEIQ